MKSSELHQAITETVKEELVRAQGRYLVSPERFNQIEDICTMIDSLLEYIECDFIDVLVQEPRKTIILSIVCDEIILRHSEDSQFSEIIQKADSFSFSKYDNEHIRINLNIEGLLVRADG